MINLTTSRHSVLRRIQTIVFAMSTLTLTSIMVACSGGSTVLSGGVGSGGSGVAEGPVSGFGSVIVAGVEYDDTNATVLTENAAGQTELAEIKLGQRVRIQHSHSAVADTIQILPQIRGTATSAQDSQGVFQILGQTVQIISASDANHTATVLEGLTSVSSGDELEIHGEWVFDSTRNYSMLIATRVEKLSASVDPVLVSGVVRTRAGHVVTLDDAQGQTLAYAQLPENLASQSLITAWVARSALSTNPWSATRVMNASPEVKEGETLLLNTQVSKQDVEPGQIRVQGMLVKLDTSKYSAPAVGSSVQIEIRRSGNEFKAVTLKEREHSSEFGGAVELKGSITWPSDSSQLSLRGNLVNIPSGALDSSCSRVQANDNTYVEIEAARASPGQPLLATRVSCTKTIPTSSVIEVSGTLQQIDTINNTLTLATQDGTLSLTWSSASLLPRNITDLLNRRVEVEYQTVNGANRLRKLKPH